MTYGSRQGAALEKGLLSPDNSSEVSVSQGPDKQSVVKMSVLGHLKTKPKRASARTEGTSANTGCHVLFRCRS